VTISAWAWFDDAFETSSLVESDLGIEAFIFIIGFFLYYPAFTVVFLVLFEVFVSSAMEDAKSACTGVYPVEIIPVIAAIFIGSLSMLFFSYMGGAILDTIDVTFVCFAIDKDNGVDMSGNEFAQNLVKEVPGMITVIDPIPIPDPAAGKVASAMSTGSTMGAVQMVPMMQPQLAAMPMTMPMTMTPEQQQQMQAQQMQQWQQMTPEQQQQMQMQQMQMQQMQQIQPPTTGQPVLLG